MPLNLAVAVSSASLPSFNRQLKASDNDRRRTNSRFFGDRTLSTKFQLFNMVGGQSTDLDFSDGALHDPLGLFPLLRRKISMVLACVPLSTDILEVSQEEFEQREVDLTR